MNRKFNAPVTNEVAAIIVGELDEISNHFLAIHTKGHELQTIPFINADGDPLCYPLLFPLAEPGYHVDLIKGLNTKNGLQKHVKMTKMEVQMNKSNRRNMPTIFIL